MGMPAKYGIIEYRGERYSWYPKQKMWQSTRAARSANRSLARIIWEENNGPLPDGWITFFLDGNRWNISPQNIGASSRSERRKYLFKMNPEKVEIVRCQLIYCRLLQRINHEIGETSFACRSKKTWETRKSKYGPNGGNVPPGNKKGTRKIDIRISQ